MSTPTLPPIIGPRTTIDPNPEDRYSGYTVYWVAWVLAFFAGEIPALITERRLAKAGKKDKVKRTLSANGRRLAGTDSPTGIALNVPFGKLRRLALAVLIVWFTRHISREGEM